MKKMWMAIGVGIVSAGLMGCQKEEKASAAAPVEKAVEAPAAAQPAAAQPAAAQPAAKAPAQPAAQPAATQPAAQKPKDHPAH
jgi:hypothetical protein